MLFAARLLCFHSDVWECSLLPFLMWAATETQVATGCLDGRERGGARTTPAVKYVNLTLRFPRGRKWWRDNPSQLARGVWPHPHALMYIYQPRDRKKRKKNLHKIFIAVHNQTCCSRPSWAASGSGWDSRGQINLHRNYASRYLAPLDLTPSVRVELNYHEIKSFQRDAIRSADARSWIRFQAKCKSDILQREVILK